MNRSFGINAWHLSKQGFYCSLFFKEVIHTLQGVRKMVVRSVSHQNWTGFGFCVCFFSLAPMIEWISVCMVAANPLHLEWNCSLGETVEGGLLERNMWKWGRYANKHNSSDPSTCTRARASGWGSLPGLEAMWAPCSGTLQSHFRSWPDTPIALLWTTPCLHLGGTQATELAWCCFNVASTEYTNYVCFLFPNHT